jgi:hypothetical protein
VLTHYRKKWNERLKQFENMLEYDWANHGLRGPAQAAEAEDDG